MLKGFKSQINRGDTHLSASVVGLFELHMFPRFAAKVQPLPLQPFHDRFSCQVGRVHFGDQSDIGACHAQMTMNSYNILLSGYTLQSIFYNYSFISLYF